MKLHVILGVCALWLLVAVVWGSQTVLAGNLQGNPIAAGTALRMALVQTVPWIPATLAVIALAARYPLTRESWRRSLWIHLLAFAVLVYLENVLVVLGYWINRGQFESMGMLLRGGARWAVLRVHVAALVYLAIAALTQGLLFYRQTRERELRLARVEAQLASARLAALVAQIRPHFLFNTLHTIGQLWRSGRHTEADAMLDHLGALFQRVQRSTARTLVSVEEELEMVESYLAIEQARFGDRLRVEVSVSPAARACALPPLLLQPLVENAIKHGVSAASTAGRVAVRGRVVDGRLFLEVEDDGPGVQRAANSRGSGTGLTTTRQRLIQQFGADHTLIVRNGQSTGTLVHIELPCTTTDSAETSQLVTHTSESSNVS